ncbi:MAG: ABC transporter substrate-binding protein, partial [Deltaproteobacteria bacterium]|nr:ABC transporter substrate-binding protein [Deltaproteobacteria bacterium]
MATEKNLSGLVHVLLIFLCISTVCISSLMASQPPVRLALILSQTGIAAQENIPAIKAAELAIEEINARGGLIGHPVELMIIDNKSTPLGSKAAALSAVDLGVIGVIGAFR